MSFWLPRLDAMAAAASNVRRSPGEFTGVADWNAAACRPDRSVSIPPLQTMPENRIAPRSHVGPQAAGGRMIGADMMAIEDAESEIARILKILEYKTDSLVRRVNVENNDITTCGDRRPQWSRRVVIELDPRPGTQWGQAKDAK